MAKKKEFVTTPTGVGSFIDIQKPIRPKFKTGEGKYGYYATLTLDKEDAAALDARWQKMAEDYRDELMATASGETKGKLKNSKIVSRFRPVYDDQGNETGKVKTKFFQNAIIKFKDGTEKEVKPFCVDANKQHTKKNPWSGSLIKVVFTERPYYMPKDNEFGVSADMAGIQIIKLVEGGAMGLEALDVVEDGYVDEADAFDGSNAITQEDAGSAASDGSDF